MVLLHTAISFDSLATRFFLKRTFSLTLIVILGLASCNDHNRVSRERIPNKKVELVKYRIAAGVDSVIATDYGGRKLQMYRLENGIETGWHYWFGSDGSVEEKAWVSQGVLDGLDSTFYPNGRVETVSLRKGDNILSISKSFYQNGQIQTIKKHFVKNGKSFLNEVISLRSNGDTDKLQSNYIEYYARNENLSKKRPYIFMIKTISMFRHARLCLYNFDSLDISSCSEVFDITNNVIGPMAFYYPKLGRNVHRGEIQYWNDDSSKHTSLYFRDTFFMN